MSIKKDKDDLNRIIGQNIRHERIARNMSVNDLCDSMDLTTSHLRSMESGIRGTTSINLWKFSKFFGIPIDQFFFPPGTSKDDESNGESPASKVKRKKIVSLVNNADDVTLDFIASLVKEVNALAKEVKE